MKGVIETHLRNASPSRCAHNNNINNTDVVERILTKLS